MKLLALPFALLAVAAAAPSAGAAQQGSFCGVVRGVANDLKSSTTLQHRTNVRAAYMRIHAAEPALNASAPSTLKPHLRPVLGFVNVLIADFDKAGWTMSGMQQYLPALVPKAQAVNPHLLAVEAYIKGTCKIR